MCSQVAACMQAPPGPPGMAHAGMTPSLAPSPPPPPRYPPPPPPSSPLHEMFEVKKLLGRGVYGDVFEAVDKASGETQAVKTFAKRVNGVEAHPSTHVEVAAMRRARGHPYIVDLKGFCLEHGPCQFAYMEKCGPNLHTYQVSRCPHGFGIQVLKRATWQLARGIAHLHKLGVWHRDIKPANLLVSPDRQGVKIADFGLALLRPRRLDWSLASLYEMGTPGFVALEVLLAREMAKYGLAGTGTVMGIEPYSHKIDGWALAASLWQLGFGRALIPVAAGWTEDQILFDSVRIQGLPKPGDMGGAMGHLISCIQNDGRRSHRLPTGDWGLFDQSKEAIKERLISRLQQQGVTGAPVMGDAVVFGNFMDLLSSLLLPPAERPEVSTIQRYPFVLTPPNRTPAPAQPTAAPSDQQKKAAAALDQQKGRPGVAGEEKAHEETAEDDTGQREAAANGDGGESDESAANGDGGESDESAANGDGGESDKSAANGDADESDEQSPTEQPSSTDGGDTFPRTRRPTADGAGAPEAHDGETGEGDEEDESLRLPFRQAFPWKNWQSTPTRDVSPRRERDMMGGRWGRPGDA
ncbi:unnamed protein product [Vitrella brassicaformis CCMP3155]|uniref:Protein kinase domain-containing protein n=1 Tax=Vitrella brassicaformis (strain CCMP3155) TaxID=1169540 RepID=A0A0G4GUG1_VITBC|nr:unnamed protein product [Vitrella brassicaformis CCMP3155]|eukprot:CEM34475.1 unnamed protein product [Vitrella brassicaformis CCMP3155]